MPRPRSAPIGAQNHNAHAPRPRSARIRGRARSGGREWDPGSASTTPARANPRRRRPPGRPRAPLPAIAAASASEVARHSRIAGPQGLRRNAIASWCGLLGILLRRFLQVDEQALELRYELSLLLLGEF